MRKITLLLILVFSSSALFAQVGVGTLSPDSSSVIDLSSNDKGLLIPRLTQSERNNINAPAHTLMVFCVDCSPTGIYYYDTNATAWTVLDTDTQLDESAVDAFVANNGYLSSFTEVDGSISNELQTISRSGTTVTLSNNGGTFQDSVLTETDVDAMVANNNYLTSFTEVDGSISNEIQNLNLNSNTLSIDGANSVDLSSYLDNTDDQAISRDGLTVTLEDGGTFQDSVLTETDVDAMVANNGYLTSQTDDQTISRDGLTVTLESGGTFQDSVLTETDVDAMVANNNYLTSFTEVDGSISNEIQNLNLNSNTLSIDGANSVDLSSYLDNTDDQAISRDGLTVTLEDGGTFQDSVLTETDVDAMVANNGYLTSQTDDQTISRDGLTVTLENGGAFQDSVLTETDVDAMVANNNYLTSFTEVDGSISNEIQNLNLNSNTLSIDGANSVDLSSYLDNTDNQAISRDGLTVTLENGGTFQDSVLTETDVDAMVANNGYLTSQSDDQTISRDGLTVTLENGGTFQDSVLTETDVDAMVANNGYLTSQTDDQTVSRDGLTVTLENGGSFQDSVLTETDVDAMVANNNYLTSFTEVDGSISNEIQNLNLNSNTLSIDGANSVDLSSYIDNTDDQAISRDGLTVTLEDGGTFQDSVLTETDVDAMVADNGFAVGQIWDRTNNVISPGSDANYVNDDFVFGSDELDADGKAENHRNRMIFDKSKGFFAAGRSTDEWADSLRGEHSASFGMLNEVEGDASFATGERNKVSGNYGAVFGYSNYALNSYGYAFGSQNYISGSNVLAQGIGNNIPYNNGVAMGTGLENNSSHEFIFGFYNETYNAANTTGNNDQDHLFVIGNGTNPIDRSNAVTVLKGGEMGIGTSTPTHTLDVSGEGRFTDSLTIGAYTLPPSDGTANQVLSTDGNGEVSWATDGDASSSNEIQNLNLNSNTLSIDGANSVDLSSYLDNTDDQAISRDGLTVTLENGGSFQDSVLTETDVDAMVANNGYLTSQTDDQTISRDGLTVTLENGGTFQDSVLTETDVDAMVANNGYLTSQTDDQTISRDGLTVTLENGGSFQDSVDNLGNHTATENLQLNGNWISNDGGDEGISVLDNGRVGVGVDSAHTMLHVEGGNISVNGQPNVVALFGSTAGSGYDGRIELRSIRESISSSDGGVILSNYDANNGTTNVAGDLAIYGQDNNNNLGGVRLRTSADGSTLANGLIVDKDQNVEIPNGSLTVGPYTLPTTDGEENEVLVTDGSGNISWEDAASAYSKVWNFSFIPSERDSLHENYIGTFNCSSGPVKIEITDGGNGLGASGQYVITRDFGSSPIVSLHLDGLVGDGYGFYYRIISGCAYELFFDLENGNTTNATFTVNVSVGGYMSETISSATSSNILECRYGITESYLGRVGIGVKNPNEEFEVNGDGLVSGTFKVGAYTLPSTDGASDQVLKTNGSGTLSWSNDETTDNLGDHTATQNIELNGNWLSNDGGDEGISVQNNGFVGVGTDSAHTPFHVSTNTTQNDISSVYALFGRTGGSGLQDGKIELRSIRTGVSNSEGGVVLSNYDLNIDSTHVMGDMAVWGRNNTTNRGGIRFRTSANGSYAGMTNALTIDENQNVSIPNGNLTLGAITLPVIDGTANQVLKTDGSGNVSWTNGDDIVTSVLDTANGVVIPGSAVNYATDDFVFGSDALDAHGKGTDHESRIIFDKSQSFFAAGYSTSQWTDSLRGQYAAAFGENNKAIGSGTFVAGTRNTARGQGAAIFGTNNEVTGEYGLTAGNGNVILADFGLAVGNTNYLVGEYSSSFGALNLGQGDYIFNVGRSNEINADYGTTFGQELESMSPYEFVTGYYNEKYTPSNSSGNNDNDRLFVIGNGTNNSNRSNAVTVLKGGEFGIGNSSPSHTLDVSGDGRFTQSLGIGDLSTTESPLQVAQVSNTVGNLSNVLAVFGDSWEGTPFSNSTVEIRGKMDDISTGVGASLTLTNYDNDNASTNIMGDLATFGQDGNQNQGGLQLRTSTDGTNLTTAIQIDRLQNVYIPNGDLSIGQGSFDAAFHAGTRSTVNGISDVVAVFGNNDGTLSSPLNGVSEYDGKVEIRSHRYLPTQSNGGLLFSNYDGGVDLINVFGDITIDAEDDATNLGGLKFRTSVDGTYGNLTNALTIDKSQNVSIPNGNLTVSGDLNAGNLTVGSVTLPSTDGNSGDVLVTDGSGNASWENAGVPIGSIQMWATATPPTGWLICNGSSFNAGTYPELQAVLGTTNTPNLSGRMPLGVGQSNEPTATNHSLGSVGGEESVTLTIAQMPAHSHDIRYREGEESGGGNDYSDLGDSGVTDSTESEGGSQAHENMPPFYTLYFIIKASN